MFVVLFALKLNSSFMILFRSSPSIQCLTRTYMRCLLIDRQLFEISSFVICVPQSCERTQPSVSNLTMLQVEREPAGPTDHNAESFGSRPGINLRMWTPTLRCCHPRSIRDGCINAFVKQLAEMPATKQGRNHGCSESSHLRHDTTWSRRPPLP